MNLLTTIRGLRGNHVGMAIEELHRSENDLADSLLSLADLHKTDHEICHVARDVAAWSHEHVRRLAGTGSAYGVELDAAPRDRSELLAGLKQKSAELMGHSHAPGLLLISDLRHVHRKAAGVSLDWEVLAQTAQALEDAELLGLAEDCHPQTLRQLRWANSKVKELSAQVMVTG
ncbi:MAG: hypothetical protein ACJ72E_03260 [Marmoricola sp.]